MVLFPNLTSTGKIFTGCEFGGLGHANSLNAEDTPLTLANARDYGDPDDTMKHQR